MDNGFFLCHYFFNRLAVSLLRNYSIKARCGRTAGAHLEMLRPLMITLHCGSWFLNVDWV